MNRTLFIDIDGTLIRHQVFLEKMLSEPPEILPGVDKQLRSWYNEGDAIILTTARPEWAREITEKQLRTIDISYHQLIMDCTNGERILINDEKPTMAVTARAFTVNRNCGLENFIL